MNCSASVVYSHSWLNQTSGIGTDPTPVTVLTLSQAGQYRFSASGSATGSSPTPSLQYGIYLNGSPVSSLPFSTTPTADSSWVFAGKSGMTVGVLLDVNVSGGAGWNYDFYLTIEQLQ